MCKRVVKGRTYHCGHFEGLEVAATMDCGSRKCEKSMNHPSHCHRESCVKTWQADIEQTVQNIKSKCPRCR